MAPMKRKESLDEHQYNEKEAVSVGNSADLSCRRNPGEGQQHMGNCSLSDEKVHQRVQTTEVSFKEVGVQTECVKRRKLSRYVWKYIEEGKQVEHIEEEESVWLSS